MLEVIAERLKKAYSLPAAEQEKWSGKIKELETQADHEAVGLLIAINREIASNFVCKENGKLTKWLQDNKKVNKYLDDAERDLNSSYKDKNWVTYLDKLEDYKATMVTVLHMFKDSETKGYREILSQELDGVNVHDLFSGRG